MAGACRQVRADVVFAAATPGKLVPVTIAGRLAGVPRNRNGQCVNSAPIAGDQGRYVRGIRQRCPIGRRLSSGRRLPSAAVIVEPPSRERTSLRRAAL